MLRYLSFLVLFLCSLSCSSETSTTPQPTKFTIQASVQPTGSGVINQSPSGSSHEEGTTLSFTAVPSEGYLFKEWQGDMTGTSNPITLSLTKNISIVAHFEEVPIERPYTATLFEIDLSNKTSFSSKKIKWLEKAFHSVVYYRFEGDEFMFMAGGTNWSDAQDLQPAALLLKKVNGSWVFLEEYPTLDLTSEFRNTDFLPDGSGLVGCDHGAEVPDLNGNGEDDEWPHGHVFYGLFHSNGIDWTQVSDQKSFYHSCAVGDLNGDGDYDVVAGHLGTRFQDRFANPHAYLQSGGSFSFDSEYLNESIHSGYFVQIDDIVGDERNEVINWNFTGGDNGDFLVVDIQSPDENGVYKLYQEYRDDRLTPSKQSALFQNRDSEKETPGNWVTDFDQDGLIDIAAENDVFDTNVLFNNGDGTFERVQVVTKGNDRWDGQYNRYEHYYMGYEIIDLFNDGYPDIITREPDNYYYDSKGYIFPGDNVWINNGDRTFTRMSERYDDLYAFDPKSISPLTNTCSGFGGKEKVSFLRGFVTKEGKFGWYGFIDSDENCHTNYQPNRLLLFEIVTDIDAQYVD